MTLVIGQGIIPSVDTVKKLDALGLSLDYLVR
jgi:hypothetical protein